MASSNEEVYRKAHEKLARGTQKPVGKHTEYYEIRKIELCAELAAAEPGDLRKALAFAGDSLRPHDYGQPRVGQPRKNWVKQTTELFWNRTVRKERRAPDLPGQPDIRMPEHMDIRRRNAGRVLADRRALDN